MSHFYVNQNIQSALYAAVGSSTLTLTNFYVIGGATLAVTSLATHFHTNYAANTFLSNTTGFYPPGADTSITYTPHAQIPAFTSTLSANQLINSNSRGFYVVVIGGGGGGGGARNNTADDNGNGGGSGGSGAIVGFYVNTTSYPNSYYRYITGTGGTAGALGTNATGGVGGNASSSQFQFFNSSNVQIFSITAGGGTGGAGGKQVSEQPPPASGGIGGTTTLTGIAAGLVTGTVNVNTNGTNGGSNNVNAGGTPYPPVFALQASTASGAYNVVGTTGAGGQGGQGDGAVAPNGTAGYVGQNGGIILFELF